MNESSTPTGPPEVTGEPPEEKEPPKKVVTLSCVMRASGRLDPANSETGE